MFLRITNQGAAPDEIGYLLHKNPVSLHTVELSAGKAHVFYLTPEPDRCTVCLLVEVDPMELVRGVAQQVEEYVNDRPYAASSYLSVAMGRVFGTALAGNCAKRPDLLGKRFRLTATVEALRAQGGAELAERLFAPLGYQVNAKAIALDGRFPEWGDSRYVRLSLTGDVTVHDLLSHLYVLLPVLDDAKHYYVGEAEVGKLLRHGEGWLNAHPERQLITSRYLKRRRELVSGALAQLLAGEERAAVESAEEKTESAGAGEQALERPLTLHEGRLDLVAGRLRELGAASVVDLGCGEGKLLRRLLADRAFTRIAGMDVTVRTLEIAARKLGLDQMPEAQRRRIELFQGSLVYRDRRLEGFDAAALVEVIEHLDAPRLAALERTVFEFARPRFVLVTTPNREYNVLFPGLAGDRLRHGDHRFEWTRAEFDAWAQGVAGRFGYEARLEPVGPEDAVHGAPTQMAVFMLPGGGAR